MLGNILVPYDGSACAMRAFKLALRIGKEFDSTLTVIICLKGPNKISLYYSSKFNDLILRKQKTTAIKLLSKLEENANKSGLSIKSKILNTSSIVKSITAFAKPHNMDLIVMGSRGHGSFKKMILGSVSSGVLHYSPCPVLVVK